jgi:hypothetical protein
MDSLSADDVRKLFAEGGDAVYFVEDSVIGDRVLDMKTRGFPIETAEGLDFCKHNVLDNRVSKKVPPVDLSNMSSLVRLVLGTLFPWSGLGIYEVYRTEANHYYAFMTGLGPELIGVAVGLCSPEFNMELRAGSNLLPIRGWWASNGLLEMPPVPLRACETIDIALEKGGLYDHRPHFLRAC